MEGHFSSLQKSRQTERNLTSKIRLKSGKIEQNWKLGKNWKSEMEKRKKKWKNGKMEIQKNGKKWKLEIGKVRNFGKKNGQLINFYSFKLEKSRFTFWYKNSSLRQLYDNACLEAIWWLHDQAGMIHSHYSICLLWQFWEADCATRLKDIFWRPRRNSDTITPWAISRSNWISMFSESINMLVKIMMHVENIWHKIGHAKHHPT